MKKILILGLINIFFSPICLGNQSENLQKLNDLFEEGILTKNQFNEAKEKILQKVAISNDDKVFLEELSGGESVPVQIEYTMEHWLSNYEIIPEDLSSMIKEAEKIRTEAGLPTPTTCSADFCFTDTPEYAQSDEIINKERLLTNLFRYHPDFVATPATFIGKDKINLKIDHKDGLGARWLSYTEDEVFALYKIKPEDIPVMLEPYNSVSLQYGTTDEIINTDQLIQSLLLWDPNLYSSNHGYYSSEIIHKWVDGKIVIEGIEEIRENLPPECGSSEKPVCHAVLHNPPSPDPPIEPVVEPQPVSEPTDPNPPPKNDPGIEYAPESLSDDPPIESAPGEGKQEPDHCGSPPCPEENLEPPPKLADPTVLQPIDPGIEGDSSSEPTSNMNDSKVEIKEMTKEEKKQHRIDTETLRRANEGDFSDHIKRELDGAAARLGVIPPKEEDFSQNIQTGQSGDGTTSKKTSSPSDPNPPPKIPEKGNFAPESVSDDPPIKSAPGEGKQEPNHCGSPPCP